MASTIPAPVADVRVNAADRRRYERWLVELTALPTAAGREDRVIRWVEAWVAQRNDLRIRRDRFGNLMIQRHGARGRRPIVLAAHMDHPAFVVDNVQHGRDIEAVFRGGVAERFFPDGKVRLHADDGSSRPGRIARFTPRADRRDDHRVTVRFARAVDTEPGQILTWDLGPARIARDRLRAPACDDLAGVAAALATLDLLGKPGRAQGRRRGRATTAPPDVRLLLTRAEEVGWIGAIGACDSGLLPKTSRVLALENSKSFAESPIGGGAILRVGDAISTFDHELNYRIAEIAKALADADADFRWQRKLMPGGGCEASAFQAFGLAATCLCLPLGNYHNMDDARGRPGLETISLADFHHLVRLLHASVHGLDDGDQGAFRRRLDDLFEARRDLVD